MYQGRDQEQSGTFLFVFGKDFPSYLPAFISSPHKMCYDLDTVILCTFVKEY